MGILDLSKLSMLSPDSKTILRCGTISQPNFTITMERGDFANVVAAMHPDGFVKLEGGSITVKYALSASGPSGCADPDFNISINASAEASFDIPFQFGMARCRSLNCANEGVESLNLFWMDGFFADSPKDRVGTYTLVDCPENDDDVTYNLSIRIKSTTVCNYDAEMCANPNTGKVFMAMSIFFWIEVYIPADLTATPPIFESVLATISGVIYTGSEPSPSWNPCGFIPTDPMTGYTVAPSQSGNITAGGVPWRYALWHGEDIFGGTFIVTAFGFG